MKKKFLLLTGLVGLGLTLSLNIEPVRADGNNNCRIVRNYYFLSEINTQSYVEKLKGSGFPWNRTHITEYTVGEVTKRQFADAEYGQIKLVKNGETDSVNQWTLTDFYKRNILAAKAGGEYETTEDGVEVHYLLHGAWYEEGGEIQYSGVDYSDVEVSELVNGSIIPTDDDLKFMLSDNSIVNIQITRHIEYSDVFSSDSLIPTPFEVAWKSDTVRPSILTPALGYLQYEVCDYPVRIQYLEEGTNKTLASDYTDTVANNTSYPVTSPSISGYTLVKSSDSVVTVNVEGKPFEYIVYYRPNAVVTPSNPDENIKQVQTGDSLIYVVWGVGALALGYSVYYFNKYYRKNKNEI